MFKKILFITIYFTVSVLGQKKAVQNTNLTPPKLVVGIVVDQMRYDFLYRYQAKYGKGGFNRLMKEGFNCKNLHYNYAPTVTAAGHSAIFTGSAPALSGIAGNEWYDRKLGRTVYCTEDSTTKTIGNKTNAGKMSPKNLEVSSIADQLRIAQMFQNKTIGIALKDRGAILPAGHTANAAYWFDGYDGNWISSSFYIENLPLWVQNFNELKSPNKFLNTTWNTLLPIEKYTESTPDDEVYEGRMPGEKQSTFPHELIGSRGNIYETIKTTPFGNTITKDFALAAIDGENLGKGKFTDFLSVSFSSPDYAGHAFGPQSIEIEDIYLRLDKDIEEMLLALDKKVGVNEYVVFLSADHGVADVPGFWIQNRLPAGVINPYEPIKKIKATLKEKYNSDKIIEGEANYQIYLDKAELKRLNISISDVYEFLKPIIMDIEGIGNFINLHHLSAMNLPTDIEQKIKNGLHPTRSGDLYIMTKPQWIASRPTGTTHGSAYNYDSHVPVLFFGKNIPKGETVERYSITDIAPTIANILNILAGSGNMGNPIPMK